MARNQDHSRATRVGGGLLAFALALNAPMLAQSVLPASTIRRPPRRVLVSLPDCKLAVLEDGQVIRIFPIAVGAVASPSPTGEFTIAHRLTNPTYYHPGVVIPPGKDNPLGTRWVGLSQKGFGIHGTNQPWSVGKPASHGCIRMRNRDVEEFFGMVRVGDTVEIRGERDEQVAQIFGDGNGGPVVAQGQSAELSQASGGQ